MPQLPSQYTIASAEESSELKRHAQNLSQPSSGPGTPRAGSPEQLLNRVASVHGQVGLLQEEVREMVRQGTPPQNYVEGLSRGRLPESLIIGLVEKIFRSCDRRSSGRVGKADFRAMIMSEADLLQNHASLDDILGLERLLRMLEQQGAPYEIDWDFVVQSFANRDSPRRYLSFEDQLGHAFTAVSRGNGKAPVQHILREMRQGGCSDPNWATLTDVLEAGPQGLEVSFDDLVRMRHASVPRERGLLDRPFAEGFAQATMAAVARRSPSPPSPLGAFGLSTIREDFQAMSPSTAKRRLRADAVADRVASLRNAPQHRAIKGDGVSRSHHQGLSTRLHTLETKVASFSAEEADRVMQLGDKIQALESLIDEEGKALQRNARGTAARLQSIREQFKAGNTRREMMETAAPRVYKFLMQGAEGMQLTVGTEQSPVARAKEDLALDGLLTELRVKGEQLDDIIHKHGLGEERLTHSMRKEVKTLTAEIEEERAKRKHMESVFVTLMENIISRLYEELGDAFNERKAMDARLQTRLQDAVAIISGAVL